jgi:hypothetical protein
MRVRQAGLTVVALAAILGLALLTGAPVDAKRVGSALFGKPFVSSEAVVKNGHRAPLVEGTRIRVRFAREDQRHLIRWRAGCNFFGARVEITPTRLEVGQVTGTAIGCERPLALQERWVSRFIGSDPDWVRHGRKLRLTRHDDVIRLRRPAR